VPSSSRVRWGARALVASAGAALVASSLALVAAPAHAAPVDLTILAINDFHGRIDANTTKWATTIETIRAAKGDDNSLLVSGGDNIGASLFSSAYAEDQPTVDVMNALGLATTAAGNHEFDRGFDWLKANLIDGTNPDYRKADYSILGDNVYDKTTNEPAMDESYRATVAGLDVCVAGAVTEETPSLVSPGGISQLLFKDPVDEVNRVVAEMEADAPCDVTIAAYHEGAPDGTKTLAENVAASPAFASIVNETDPSVDAIITAHTHQLYAYDAPIPGAAGTRPVIQTGSYGDHVGQIDLAVDNGVVTYTQQNVARAAAENLALPRVAAVKTIVDNAIAAADQVGNKAIGTITDDITTAFTGGTYGPDGYTGGTRDDRASESTLGHLVADALRDTPIAGQPTPDIGITNPGGLRSELLYAGDTSTSPANTDGVVTFEEANSVLPFVNNVSYVDVTGSTLREILEQQWQTNADGTIPSRPYLALGLSKNVKVRADGSRPLGDRITSVMVNGDEVKNAAHYKIATFSFLATGGDNFRAFKDGVATDTGKIDRDLWIDGFFANGGAKSPDFARRQVFTNAPTKVVGGEQVTFGLTKLDLTSLGTKASTTLTATLHQPGGAADKVLGTFPVTDGAATVDLTMPGRVARGSTLRLVTDANGTQVPIRAVPAAKADSHLTVTRKPQHVAVDKTRTKLKVAVASGDAPANGKVRVKADGHSYTMKLSDGVATFELKPFHSTGKHVVKVKYLGTWQSKADSLKLTVKVHKK
jgi:2',3'-cyclic-nucleotide 2'-phosphodiesterase (5'-nucleotidase family)